MVKKVTYGRNTESSTPSMWLPEVGTLVWVAFSGSRAPPVPVASPIYGYILYTVIICPAVCGDTVDVISLARSPWSLSA